MDFTAFNCERYRSAKKRDSCEIIQVTFIIVRPNRLTVSRWIYNFRIVIITAKLDFGAKIENSTGNEVNQFDFWIDPYCKIPDKSFDRTIFLKLIFWIQKKKIVVLTFDKFCQYVRYERTYMRASCHPASSKKKYIYIHIKWKKMFSRFPFAVTRIFLNVQTFLVISSHFSLFNTCNFFPRFFISPFNLRYKSKPTINPREYVNVRKKGEGRNWRIHPADTYIFISTRSNRAASENDARI